MDKQGGLPIPFHQLRAFDNCLLQSGLTEIKAMGFNFTWRRKGLVNNTDKKSVNNICLHKFGIYENVSTF